MVSWRFKRVSQAWYTSPIPPTPSFTVMRQWESKGPIMALAPVGRRQSLQLFVFSLGLFQDRDVGVSVFPEVEKLLIHFTALGRIAAKRRGAC